MKYKKTIFTFTLILAFILTGTGCPSLPKKEYAEANTWKEKIQKFQLDALAKEDVKKANEKYDEGKTLYEKKDKKNSKKALTETLAMYKAIYEREMPIATEQKKDSTTDFVQEAKDLKAAKKFQTEYDEALVKFEAAKAAEAKGDLETAYTSYSEAIVILEKINTITKENKAKADGTLNQLNEAKTKLDQKIDSIETDNVDVNAVN